MSFRALYLTKNPEGTVLAGIHTLEEAELPGSGDVLVKLDHSTLNFKDGLAITNRSPVVRNWPMVAGIDGAGRVLESNNKLWKTGDFVILNGWGVGETHWGCLSQKARLKGEWLVRLPRGLSTRDAMAIGTAGYTAMLCVMALEQNGVRPGDGEVLVTGATGGVGSIAVALLAKLGYRVVASSGKASQEEFLTTLGAAEVMERYLLAEPGKPLQRERWAGVIDVAGSHTLVNACAQTRYGGVVVACGLAQGMDFPASVAPFILRNVKLVGVDSVMAPRALREQAWSRLARELDHDKLDTITREIALTDALEFAKALMDGEVRGRLVVDVNR